jgi:hypothetical protein
LRPFAASNTRSRRHSARSTSTACRRRSPNGSRSATDPGGPIRPAPGSTAVAVLVAALALAGCGGGGEDEAAPPPPPPKLAKATAGRLVARSDTIALKLAAGDECGAAHEADALNADAIAAVNAGEIPAAFQEELVARTQELVNAVNCPPPVVQPQPQAEEDQGEQGSGRGKKKGHEKEKSKKKDKG